MVRQLKDAYTVVAGDTEAKLITLRGRQNEEGAEGFEGAEEDEGFEGAEEDEGAAIYILLDG